MDAPLKLSASMFPTFISENAWVVVLFDATWTSGLKAMIRPRFELAAREHGGRVKFGEVDIDADPDLARQVGILNVPTVAYYRDGELVAALISAQQDVSGRTKALVEGLRLGYNDDLDVVPV